METATSEEILGDTYKTARQLVVAASNKHGIAAVALELAAVVGMEARYASLNDSPRWARLQEHLVAACDLLAALESEDRETDHGRVSRIEAHADRIRVEMERQYTGRVNETPKVIKETGSNDGSSRRTK